MKKLIVTAMIIFTVTVCFTACKKDEVPDAGTATDKVVDISEAATTKGDEFIDFETTRPKEEPSTIKPNKTMRINVPWSLLENEADGNVDKFAALHGYKITKEKDGTATMKMDGMAYSFLLSKVGMNVITSLGDLVDSGDCPYLVRLADYSEDFSYLLMQVDTKIYKKYKDDIPYADLAQILGQTGLYYQYFTVEEDNKCEVVLASSRTGKVVYSETFTD